MLTRCRKVAQSAFVFGIDQVAAAADDAPDVLRRRPLDTEVPLPPAAVVASRDPVGTADAKSWLPFTGLGRLREAAC